MSTYTPIASQTLTGSVATITFSNIPQTFTDLILVCRHAVSIDTNTQLRLNSDSGNNYSTTFLRGNGSTASSVRATNQGYMDLESFGFPTTVFGAITTAHIMNYTNSTTNKTILSRGSNANSGSGVSGLVHLWRNTAAINTMTLSTASGTFSSDSTFSLYGIAAGSPKAQGGQVTTDGTYWYHTFNSSGVLSVNQNITADFLVIGGGGSGGIGGGGGAGGYRTSVGTSGGGSSAESALSLTAGSNYTAVIGAGGPSVNNTNAGYPYGYSGTSTYFSTITSVGGGYGGASAIEYNNRNGGNGGSGGGGGYNAGSGLGAGGSPTSNQGYAGGSTVLTQGSGAASYASGGGGAGAAGGGVTSSSSVSGNGGNGITSSISGTSVARGGGGGGATANTNTGCGTGGTGGGGNALTASNAGNGTANTGGGGGGQGGQLNVNYTSGTGGSGVVIVRYAV